MFISYMCTVGRAIHGLSETSIVTLTIHGKARTVTKSHYCSIPDSQRYPDNLWTTHYRSSPLCTLSPLGLSIPGHQGYYDSPRTTTDGQPCLFYPPWSEYPSLARQPLFPLLCNHKEIGAGQTCPVPGSMECAKCVMSSKPF